MKKETISPEVFIDPVCFMKVDPTMKDLMFTYQMRTYYFCAEGCRKDFEIDPDKYLASKPLKHKGWMGRYLEQLKNLSLM